MPVAPNPSARPGPRPAPGGAATTAAADWPQRAHGLIEPALAGIVEGAWIAIVYAAWQVGLAHDQARLSPILLAIPAWLGLWWIRSQAAPGREVTGLGLLTIVAALAGVAVDPSALGALLGGDPGTALAHHAPGALAGLAVLRGARHRAAETEDLVIGQLLRWALPAMALPWLMGGLAPEPSRTAFVAAAFPDTLLLVTAGLLAVGLARLDEISRDVGADLSLRRSWTLLALAVLAVMALVAVPAALLLGAPLGAIVDGLLGPLATLIGVLLLPLLALAVALVAVLQAVPLHGVVPSAGPPASSAPGNPVPVTPNAEAAVALGGAILLVVGFVVLVYLVARWDAGRRRREGALGEVPQSRDERSLALPLEGLGRPGWRPPWRATSGGRPQDASAAYVAWMSDLERRPERARRPSETPAAHAARLRREAGSPLGAGLLAADFELERYGRRRLSRAETARALGRWRDLRAMSRPDGSR